MTTVTAGRSVDRRRSTGAGGPRLYERAQILGEFQGVFGGTLPVSSTTIVLEGAWGTGKTALCRAACAVADQEGGVVLRARGGEAEKRTAFGIVGRFVESIGDLLGDDPPAPQAAAWKELVRTLGADGSAAEVAARFYAMVVALCEAGPVLLAVDDADLGDRDSLDVLRYLVHRFDGPELWLLVTTRPLAPGTGLRPVDALHDEPGTRRFTLAPLGRTSVRAILAEYFDEEPDPVLVEAWHTITGGRPLFMSALLSAMENQRPHPSAELAARLEGVPAPRITQVVLRRLALIPVAATDLVQAAAILGEGADPTVVRELAKVDPLVAERALDAAAEMELVRHGRPVTFVSPLVRMAVERNIPTARRSHLHARAARLLAEHGAGDVVVACHLLATMPGGDEDTAEWLRSLARSRLAVGDLDLAVACLERALAEPPPADRRGDVHLDLAAAELVARRPGALTHFRKALQLGVTDDGDLVRTALALVRTLADAPKLRAEAVVAVRSVVPRLAGVDRDLQIDFELALSMVASHPAQRSRGLSRLGHLLNQPGDDRRPAPRMAQAFLTMHRVGRVDGITADDVVALLGTVPDAALLVGGDPVASRVQVMACYALLCADRYGEVDEVLLAARSQARREGLVQEELDVSLMANTSFLWRGSLTAAEEEGRSGRRLVAQLGGGQWSRPTIGLMDALVRQGRADDAVAYDEDLVPGEIEDPIIRAAARGVRGRLLVARDLPEDGLVELLAAGDDIVSAGIVNPAFNSWRADAALTLSALGRRDEAVALADEHLGLARSFGAVRSIGLGLRARASASADHDERVGLLTQAVETLERSPARLEAAYALVELGMALVDRKDREAARGPLRRGANLASVCGAHRLVEFAGVQLRAAGARPRRLGTVGPDSLTPAELRVVRLAAEGSTNQEIAEALFVTVKTVEGHLAKAFRKLGVDSRRALSSAMSEGADVTSPPAG